MKSKLIKKIVIDMIPWLNQSEKIYRLYCKANKCIVRKKERIAYYYFYKIYKKFGCYISPKAKIGKNLKLPHPNGVVIGAEAIIGDNVTVYQNVTIGRKEGNILGCPTIGNNVTIYCNSVVVGDISIGDNTIIGCNSTILKSVEPNSQCVGVVK